MCHESDAMIKNGYENEEPSSLKLKWLNETTEIELDFELDNGIGNLCI